MKVTTDSAKSAVRVAVSRALAQALILGIDNCAEEGHALTQVQQVDLAVMSHMAYHQALEVCERLDFESRLSR